jgi:hypothetical protein
VRELTDASGPVNALSQKKIVATLEANWMNGTDLGSQKAIAKSLIKLNLQPQNARALANATGVDPSALTAIATSIAAGTPLSSAETDVFARFDKIYRNWTRALAALTAIALAMAGGRELRIDPAVSLLVGLLATPLAPMAKDISSALAMAVSAMQLAKK